MKRSVHEQARELIAVGDGLSESQQAWLRAHLERCEACVRYAQAANEVVRSLRSLPLAANSRLVRATQMRVRFHAGRLQEARQRMWLVGTCCLAVGLSATVTAPLLWRLFAWLGEWAGVAPLIWQVGFVSFFVAPALVISVLFLARGTHWTDDRERWQQWR